MDVREQGEQEQEAPEGDAAQGDEDGGDEAPVAQWKEERAQHEGGGEGGCLVEQEIGQESPEQGDHGAYMREIGVESRVMRELKADVHVGKRERGVY